MAYKEKNRTTYVATDRVKQATFWVVVFFLPGKMLYQYRSWAKCFFFFGGGGGGPNLAEQNLGESRGKNPENF